MIECGHITHCGLHRATNEDAYAVCPETGLYLVADGMGGHAHGARAAAIARDTVSRATSDGHTLEAAVRAANHALLAAPEQRDGQLPMGTTLAALRIHADSFEAAWIGDSRIYLYHDRLRQLSHDHSVVQDMVDNGTLSASEARGNRQRNLLTQALGITAHDDLRIEHVNGPLAPGMRFVLCSDGLVEHVTDSALERTLARDDLAAQELCEHLLLQALDGGGHDNVTALVLRCGARVAG